jgi:tetrahydromethanopterin S-methyltransferase subunit G
MTDNYDNGRRDATIEGMKAACFDTRRTFSGRLDRLDEKLDHVQLDLTYLRGMQKGRAALWGAVGGLMTWVLYILASIVVPLVK